MFPITGTLELPTSRTCNAALVIALAMLCASCAGDVPTLGHTRQALSAAQCDSFAVNGTTRICHATGSARNPYVVLNVAESACVHAHAGHSQDYIAVNDPTCGGLGCLPVNAPCDATLGCCSGLTCRSGTCQPVDRCAGVTCTPNGACDYATCNPATGACVHEVTTGNPCDDGNACTSADACAVGSCAGRSTACSDDGNPCTAESCDPATGCHSGPIADGTVCTLANAAASCRAGTCTVLTCSGTFANCDGSGANGCEADLATDPNHCGACGFVCHCATPSRVAQGRLDAVDSGGWLAFDGNVAIVSRYNAGIDFFDVSDIAHPRFLSTASVAEIGGIGAIWRTSVHDHYAYVPNGNGLQVLDIHDPSHPERVGGISFPDGLSTVQVVANMLYVFRYGLEVYDLSNGAHPAIIGALSMAIVPGLYPSVNARLYGTRLYTANLERGIGIVDVSTPASPVVRSVFMPSGSRFETVAAMGTTVVATDFFNRRVYVIDATDAAHPTQPALITLPDGASPLSVDTDGTLAYVTARDAGTALTGSVFVYDLSTPSNPTPVATIRTASFGPMESRVVSRHALVIGRSTDQAVVSEEQVFDLHCLATAPAANTPAAAFTLSSNPSQGWSFGWTTTRGGAFQLFDNPLSGLYGEDQWNRSSPGGYHVFWNPTGADIHPWGTTTLPSHRLALHPGPSGEYSVVRWTAPASGHYDVAATFTGISGYGGAPPTTTDVAVLRGAGVLFSGQINLGGHGNDARFSGGFDVTAGETIDFVVGFGNDSYYWDSTQLDASVTRRPP